MNAVNQQPATNNRQPKYQCRHIFTDGHRCGSICLRGEPFCYYHHTTRKPAPRKSLGQRSSFDLPLPEDRSAIQSAIGMILQRIASNDLDPRRAGLLLYGLQIASLNLPKPQPQREEEASEQVHEITTDPELGTLAPQTEIEEKKSSIAQLLEDLTSYPVPSTSYLALQQPPLSQIPDEPQIGREEVVAGESRERRPLDVVEDAVIQVAIELVDDEELQVDGAPIAVLMADAGDAAPNGGGDPQLLVELARERLLGGLASLDLAPGELPLEAHRLVGPALADQHLSMPIPV